MNKPITWRITRNIASAIVFVLVLTMFWIGGLDFDKRSPMVAMAIGFAVCGTFLCWTFPGWREDDNR